MEYCYFNCGNKTKYWHLKTNQPICKECSKKHKVSEIEKSTPNYKSITKKQL
jgi:DNA polymerase III psi subunit